MDIIEYFDFCDTKKALVTSKVLVGSSPAIVPTNSDANFVQIVDEHNKLVREVQELKKYINEEIKNIKYYTK